MLKFLLFFLSGVSFLIFSSFIAKNGQKLPTVKKYQTEYVVVLIIDGPRFSETFGDTTYTYIPRMGNDLKKQGVLYSNFRNNGPTYTNAGHTAITTGHYQSISNAGKELPKCPSMFHYFLKEKQVDKTQAWIISSKGKLEILANTKSKHWWNMYMPSTYCGPLGQSAEYNNDAATMTKVKQTITANHPKLMLINLLAVDTYGHSNNWEMYLNSIKTCDAYAFELWNTIQADPEMRNKTALFITNDHGRHLNGRKDGFVNHGDKCEGCKHISLLALGPDFKTNTEVKQGGEQIDISKTISLLLNFSMPTSDGKVLTELFH